jgi:hypothetical protein
MARAAAQTAADDRAAKLFEDAIARVESRIRAADPRALAEDLVELYDWANAAATHLDHEMVTRLHDCIGDVVYGRSEPAASPDIDLSGLDKEIPF